MLRLAAEVANECRLKKSYKLGAVAIRSRDQVIVKALNGAATEPCGWAHAEARALRKAGLEAVLYVARISRKDGQLAMARPCNKCFALLKSYRVKRCVYSIDEESYGIIDYDNNSYIETIKKIRD